MGTHLDLKSLKNKFSCKELFGSNKIMQRFLLYGIELWYFIDKRIHDYKKLYNVVKCLFFSMILCLLNINCFFLQSKKNYERKYNDADKALDSYRKADADINLSRAEVEKV